LLHFRRGESEQGELLYQQVLADTKERDQETYVLALLNLARERHRLGLEGSTSLLLEAQKVLKKKPERLLEVLVDRFETYLQKIKLENPTS
jgi:hypothetical protein